ncbi:MAG TPA: hypothetical protein VH436_19735 [Vicinamibacterales bacterium]|jgi:hypothetical protein
MPTITGAHTIIYSKSAEADRAFLRDVFGLPNVDVGHGWLIFAVPPAEVAVHPSEENNIHEFYLMTDDIRGLVDSLTKQGLKCTPPQDEGWGVLTQVKLPGGGTVGVYEPRHPRPTFRKISPAASSPKRKVSSLKRKSQKRTSRPR